MAAARQQQASSARSYSIITILYRLYISWVERRRRARRRARLRRLLARRIFHHIYRQRCARAGAGCALACLMAANAPLCAYRSSTKSISICARSAASFNNIINGGIIIAPDGARAARGAQRARRQPRTPSRAACVRRNGAPSTTSITSIINGKWALARHQTSRGARAYRLWRRDDGDDGDAWRDGAGARGGANNNQ